MCPGGGSQCLRGISAKHVFFGVYDKIRVGSGITQKGWSPSLGGPHIEGRLFSSYEIAPITRHHHQVAVELSRRFTVESRAVERSTPSHTNTILSEGGTARKARKNNNNLDPCQKIAKNIPFESYTSLWHCNIIRCFLTSS